MAGAGYKLFATGDVLTAAQVNTYLNEQTVMVFADSAARTTALSGVLAEGMMSYLQDTDSVEVYDGTSWTAVGGGGLSSPLTTKGDVWGYSTTDARIPVGANGTVLTSDSAETLGVKWAAPAGANPSFSLLSTTTLTGAATFTVSGLSGYNTFYLIVKNASSTSAQQGFRYRINGNTGNVYRAYGLTADMASSYSTSLITQSVIETTSLPLGNMSNQAGSQVSGYVRIEGCNSTGIKMTQSVGGASPESGANQSSLVLGGFIDDSSVVSSITFFTTGGNFDVGTLRIYGSVA